MKREEITIINRVAIGDMIRRSAASYHNRIALVEGEEQLTYRQLNEACNQFANYLLKQGYKKGDAIGTMAMNSIAHVIAMYGIQKAGLIWVPLNPNISINEKKYILSETKTKLLLTDERFWNKDRQELQEYPVLIMNEAKKSKDSFRCAFNNKSTKEPDVHIEDRDIAQVMFTSGTTGNPKGVCISHLSVQMAGLGNLIDCNITEHEVLLAVMPMFHCAQHTFLHSFLMRGTKIVILSSFEPIEFMKAIEKHKGSFTFMLPVMYRAIIHHPKRSRYNLSTLTSCLYAMAPMDRKTLEIGIQELKVDFMLGTGQTEIYPATMIFRPEQQLKRFGSYWGTSTITNDTAVMDKDGNILPDGQVGEIVHRGPNVMTGYLNDKVATAKTQLFGWHHTGDLGYWDEDRQMVFVDRKKDVIKTGGENVASIKVEQTLINHPKVENVVVIGLPHDRWSEAVTAFILPKNETNPTESEMIAYCKKHLGSFQVPKKVIVVNQFPVTATGKIQKQKLRLAYKHLYENDKVE